MKIADSPLRTSELKDQLRLLEAAAAGQLDGLSCPRCGKASVSVWFTQPVPNEYQTWFLCTKCDFEMRAQNSGRPAFYSENRNLLRGDFQQKKSVPATDQRS